MFVVYPIFRIFRHTHMQLCFPVNGWKQFEDSSNDGTQYQTTGLRQVKPQPNGKDEGGWQHLVVLSNDASKQKLLWWNILYHLEFRVHLQYFNIQKIIFQSTGIFTNQRQIWHHSETPLRQSSAKLKCTYRTNSEFFQASLKHAVSSARLCPKASWQFGHGTSCWWQKQPCWWAYP